MSDQLIRRKRKFTAEIQVPGDKSISHRAALLSLLCTEPVEIINFASGEDCQHSLAVAEQFGARVEIQNKIIHITPPESMQNPSGDIDCGNSGTTMRLTAGLATGGGLAATLVGDGSLSKRPMLRIAEPLRQMGASIELSEAGTAPVKISPARLTSMDYTLPVASAQVKSSILLAALASRNQVIVREKEITRDHTEIMIQHLGGRITVKDVTAELLPDEKDPRRKRRVLPTEDFKRSICLPSGVKLRGGTIDIPGDISSAAYFIALATLIRASTLRLQNVGFNPSRDEFVTLMKRLGADISVENRRVLCGESRADVKVGYAKLKSRKIAGDIVPGLIDELPIIAVCATQAEGTTVVRDAAELRVKESDRIAATVANLKAMGAKVGEFPDGFAIEGPTELNGAEIDSFGDHRIAMAFAVAGAIAHGDTVIKNSDCVDISFPGFFTLLESLW